MRRWTRLARGSVVAAMAAIGLDVTTAAQELPDLQPRPQRIVVRNVEAIGTYRSMLHSLRQWRGQNNAITTETVECDISAEFRGGGDATVNGAITFLRETRRDGRLIGRTEIRGRGSNILTRHSLRIGYVPGQPGGMTWVRWGPTALEVPVEISIGDNAPIGHTQYCETRLKNDGQPYSLRGSRTGPLSSFDVMISRPFARPGGQMLRLEQTATVTWNFAPW